jgi:O-antigen/teichoic acid export membrane protein
MGWSILLTGTRPTTVAEPPKRSSSRNRITARLFAGATGGVFRGMMTLALGSGIGRIIGIASIPVLTRLYSPGDFGVLAVFTALVAILAPLVTLRYVLALPLPRHDGVAMNLLVLSTGLMLSLTAFFTLVLWLWGAPLLAMVSMQVLAPWWWLIALGILGTAAYELLTMWATRRRAYKLIAQTNVTQSAAGALVKIGLGLAALQPLGLLVGQVVAQTGGVGRLISGFRGEMRANWRYVGASRMHKAAWRHRGFPTWRVPSQFLMVFSVQAPMLFMAALYDPVTVGQFGLAMMALTAPLSLIGKSAGSALFGEAANAIKTNRPLVLKMCKETQLRLFIFALPPAAVLIVGGEYIFTVLFGDSWLEAGRYASLLSFFLIFHFTSAPLIQVINLLAKQSVFFAINVFRFVALLAIFSFAHGLTLESDTTVLIFSLFSAAFYLAVSLFVLRELKKDGS